MPANSVFGARFNKFELFTRKRVAITVDVNRDRLGIGLKLIPYSSFELDNHMAVGAAPLHPDARVIKTNGRAILNSAIKRHLLAISGGDQSETSHPRFLRREVLRQLSKKLSALILLVQRPKNVLSVGVKTSLQCTFWQLDHFFSGIRVGE